MPTRAQRTCPRCRRPVVGPCPTCRARREQQAPSFTYDTADWTKRRAAFLRANPFCCLCGAPSTVADHWPDSRRQLLRRGVTDPDSDHRLRPLCATCHGRETVRRQPGGFNNGPT